MIFILAETHKDANHLARQNNLQPLEWKHLNNIEQIQCIEGPQRNPKSPHTIQLAGAYWRIPNICKILAYLNARGFNRA